MPRAIAGLLFRGRLSESRLADVSVPVLVLTQPDDVEHPLRSGEVLKRHIPHAIVEVAPHRGYWRNNPDKTTLAVLSFLQRLESG